MSEEKKQAIVKRGVRARALGASQFDNPYLKSDAMPAVTGETVAQWREKHDLWGLGWQIEDAIRGVTT